MISPKSLSDMLAALYAAPLQPENWQVFLDKLCADLEAVHGALISSNLNCASAQILAVGGIAFTPETQRLYNQYFSTLDPYPAAFSCNPRIGPIVAEELITREELERTEFYNELAAPNQLHHAVFLPAVLTPERADVITLWRDAKQKPFPEPCTTLELLLPHLQRSLQLHFELANLRSANRGLERALDAFNRAVFGVNKKGRVLFSNQTALRLIAQGDGLRIEEGSLVADAPAKNAELQFLVEQAAENGAGFSNGTAVLIERKSQKPPLRLTILPFAENLLGHIPGLATLIFVDDPVKKTLSRAAALRALFRLSPAETRLADLLLQGMEIREAADRLGITLETARFHLKQVFAKTGVGRQTELIRLMLSLPGVHAD